MGKTWKDDKSGKYAYERRMRDLKKKSKGSSQKKNNLVDNTETNN